jgi:hypothetical protein
MDDIEMMHVALTAARGALDSGDVPVGAAIFNKSGELISVAHNERELHNDPTAHAVIVALRRSSQKKNPACSFKYRASSTSRRTRFGRHLCGKRGSRLAERPPLENGGPSTNIWGKKTAFLNRFHCHQRVLELFDQENF